MLVATRRPDIEDDVSSQLGVRDGNGIIIIKDVASALSKADFLMKAVASPRALCQKRPWLAYPIGVDENPKVTKVIKVKVKKAKVMY